MGNDKLWKKPGPNHETLQSAETGRQKQFNMKGDITDENKSKTLQKLEIRNEVESAGNNSTGQGETTEREIRHFRSVVLGTREGRDAD